MRLAADILAKVDRTSMAALLEVRVPILDHLFVEWATGLPATWKPSRGQQKYILRKLAERGGVLRQALYRPKQGFALPLVHWIRNELKELIMSVLLEPQTQQRGFQARRRKAIARRALSRASGPFRWNLALADLRTVAPQLSRENLNEGLECQTVTALQLRL
jgi:asparagine synthetase B (glutamine-hydrolysing)